MVLLVMTLISNELCVKLSDNAIKNGMIFFVVFFLGLLFGWFFPFCVYVVLLLQLLLSPPPPLPHILCYQTKIKLIGWNREWQNHGIFSGAQVEKRKNEREDGAKQEIPEEKFRFDQLEL